MSLGEEDIKAVVFYRKEKAHATLREAEDMIVTKHWNLAMQRMYCHWWILYVIYLTNWRV